MLTFLAAVKVLRRVHCMANLLAFRINAASIFKIHTRRLSLIHGIDGKTSIKKAGWLEERMKRKLAVNSFGERFISNLMN